MPARCAIWARVSTGEQELGNQLAELRGRAARRGLDVAAEYATAGQHMTGLLGAIYALPPHAMTGSYLSDRASALGFQHSPGISALPRSAPTA